MCNVFNMVFLHSHFHFFAAGFVVGHWSEVTGNKLLLTSHWSQIYRRTFGLMLNSTGGKRFNCDNLPSRLHPRRPRGSQSGREKRGDESFQVRTKEPLGTDSHQAISRNSSGCRLLIGQCFVLLCPIGEQFLLSSFREFVHDGYCFDHGLSGSCTKQ